MSRLPISLALRQTPRVRPLIEGVVEPEGIELVTSVVTPAEVFWRQLQFGDFDVSEMSLSSLLIAREKGDDRWTALPVFPDRRFFHAGILVRADAGIDAPTDLRGRRVGVPDYQQTAALWGRGALQHEFGVSPTEIEWYMERTPELSHGGATGFTPPPGVTIHPIPPATDQYQLLLDGELDATLWYIRYPTLLDRSRGADFPEGTVRPLFPDVAAEKARYFRSVGFVPMNHTIVVRTSLLQRHPWVALNLYTAFVRARDLEHQRMADSLTTYQEAGMLGPEAAVGSPAALFPYGVQANRAALDALVEYSHEQGLTQAVADPTAMFAPSVRPL